MTLRKQLEDEASRVREQLEAMLNSENCVIILMDARRAINYARGFGLSGSQLELLSNDIERLVRTVTDADVSGKERKGNDQIDRGDDEGDRHPACGAGVHIAGDLDGRRTGWTVGPSTRSIGSRARAR